MSVSRTQILATPRVSYGPFKMVESVPWLLMAVAFRILAGDDLLQWFAAWAATHFCVLMAFIAVVRGMLDRLGHATPLDRLSLVGDLQLAGRLCVRLLAVMLVATLLALYYGQVDLGHDLLWGLDLTGLNHVTIAGRALGLVLVGFTFLLMLGIDAATNKPSVASAIRVMTAQGLRFPATLAALAIPFIALGVIQHVLVVAAWHSAVWAEFGERGRNLAGFAMVFGFASFRLWMTPTILVRGLRPAHDTGGIARERLGRRVA